MISLIMAMSQDDAIGQDGGLPWNIREEMQHFIKSTVGRTIVMGRKTWDSLPCKLPNRHNVVLSSFPVEGADACYKNIHGLMEAHKSFMVIGGKLIYELMLPYVDEVILSTVNGTYPQADVRFDRKLFNGFIQRRAEHHKDFTVQYMYRPRVGKRYRFTGQEEDIMTYMGKERQWHKFTLEGTKVWTELLDSDLSMVEEAD